MQIILKDGTVIEIAPESVPDKQITFTSPGRSALNKLWGKMTGANLEEVTVKDENGDVTQTITGLMLQDVQAHIMPDGSLHCHFWMTGGASQYYVTIDEDKGIEADSE